LVEELCSHFFEKLYRDPFRTGLDPITVSKFD
jgi:hypothetical protein